MASSKLTVIDYLGGFFFIKELYLSVAMYQKITLIIV